MSIASQTFMATEADFSKYQLSDGLASRGMPFKGSNTELNCISNGSLLLHSTFPSDRIYNDRCNVLTSLTRHRQYSKLFTPAGASVRHETRIPRWILRVEWP